MAWSGMSAYPAVEGSLTDTTEEICWFGPFTAKTNIQVVLRLTWDGVPAAGVTVKVYGATDPAADAEGRATVPDEQFYEVVGSALEVRRINIGPFHGLRGFGIGLTLSQTDTVSYQYEWDADDGTTTVEGP